MGHVKGQQVATIDAEVASPLKNAHPLGSR
jgi:hypothetical protein